MKLKKDNIEYEIMGQVNFLDENDVLSVAYTIIIDGVTITVVLPRDEEEYILIP